jgi:hypothetical protein
VVKVPRRLATALRWDDGMTMKKAEFMSCSRKVNVEEENKRVGRRQICKQELAGNMWVFCGGEDAY